MPTATDSARRNARRTHQASSGKNTLQLLAAIAALQLTAPAARAQSTPAFWPAADSGVKIENVLINNSTTAQSVTKESAVAVELDYTIVDARCPGCIDQIQYGWVNTATGAGNPVLGQCIYNGIPGAAGARGHAKLSVTAPRDPGSYALVFDRAQAYGCAQITGWWNGTPRPVQRLATIQVNAPASTDPLASIPPLPMQQLGAGVRGATIATTPVGRFVQLRYSVPGQPYDTERDFSEGPAGFNNIYGTGRPFFHVADRDRFGVVWQARNTMTVYVTWFGANPTSSESFILPLPNDALLAAATSDGAGTLYALAVQAGDGAPNNTRAGTLLKTDARGAQLARVQPDMSASGLNVANFGTLARTWVADMQFANGQLGLILGRIMHRSSDNLNHQGGVAAVFDAQSLALLRNHGQTSGHSFDNVLTRDAQGNFLGIDLGDNYPRGINLHRFSASARASRVVYTFKTEHGTSPTSPAGQTFPIFSEISSAQKTFYQWSNDNRTYTELGGVIDTAQGLVAVFSSERPSLDNSHVGGTLNDARNLAMVTVRRDFSAGYGSVVSDDVMVAPSNAEESYYYTFGGVKTPQRNTGVRWLTSYTSTADNASRVKLHPLANNEAIILWEVWGPSNYKNTYAMSVRPDGNVTQQAVALGTQFRLNRRDDLFDRAGHIYAVAGDGTSRELILNILVRGQ